MPKNRKMDKTLIIIVFALLFFSSCIEDQPDYAQEEIVKREQYLNDNNITVAPTSSGLYYIETLEGTGAAPTEGVMVEVGYSGKLLDGYEFDAGEFKYKFGSGQVINGFEEAISYMKKGGTATAIIPSHLAYGAYSIGSIPSYSTLIFDLELLEVYGEEKEIEDRNQYLIENDIEILPAESGLYYIETLAGSGESPNVNDVVKVVYKAKYLDEKVFDSGTITFTLGAGEVIDGIDEGIGYMKAGGKASLIVPSEIAYGPVGSDVIPGYTTLIYDVELVSITSAGK